ncbi:MAG: hypothetical protein QM723_40560 [Myxococcaceae bacterium]
MDGFSAKDVCRAAGINEPTLRTWRSRRLVASPGTANAWTRYPLVYLMKVVVLAELGRRGIDLEFASEFLSVFDMAEDIDGDDRNEKRWRGDGPLFLEGSLAVEYEEKRGKRSKRKHALGLLVIVPGPRVEVCANDIEDDTVTVVMDLAKVFASARARLGAV